MDHRRDQLLVRSEVEVLGRSKFGRDCNIQFIQTIVVQSESSFSHSRHAHK